MSIINFAGNPAETLWHHIRDHLALLDRVPDLESRDTRTRREAEVAMVTFMATAAWGYNPTSDEQYGSRDARFMYLSDINKDIYNLSYGKSETLVSIELGSEIKEFGLGRVTGFSAVLPLTRNGFRDYSLTVKSMSELVAGDIVPYPYTPNTVEFVLLAGLVDFRALPHYLGGDFRFPSRAHNLLYVLGRQVGNFLPKVDLWQKEGVVYAKPHTGHRFPTILCPLSGKGMGQELLETAGFIAEGMDSRHNRVWVLDLEEMNGKMKSDRYLKKLFKANRYIDRCRDSDS